MSTPVQSEVSAEAAYEAARARVLRTTDALIGAEAQIVDLSRRLDAALRGFRELEAVNERLLRAEENHWRPTDEGPAEWVCTHQGEVRVDEADPVGYTAAVGQAD